MAILGVLARFHPPDRERLLDALEALDGVTPFSVEEEQRLGILIERPTLDEARARLGSEVDRLPGILGTWPVFAHFDRDGAAAPDDPLGSVEDLQQGVVDEKDTP